MKRHPIPIYGGTLIVCDSMDEHNAVYARMAAYEGYEISESRDAPGESVTSSFVIAEHLTVICRCARRAVACHEATHCAQAIAQRVGMNPLREEEAFAYLAQWCFDRITGARA